MKSTWTLTPPSPPFPAPSSPPFSPSSFSFFFSHEQASACTARGTARRFFNPVMGAREQNATVFCGATQHQLCRSCDSTLLSCQTPMSVCLPACLLARLLACWSRGLGGGGGRREGTGGGLCQSQLEAAGDEMSRHLLLTYAYGVSLPCYLPGWLEGGSLAFGCDCWTFFSSDVETQHK